MKATVGGESFFQGFITDISFFISEKQQKYEIIASLGKVFEEIYQIDLVQKKYQILSGKNKGKSGNLYDFKQFILKTNLETDDKEKIIGLLEPSAIGKKIRNKDKISWDLKTKNGNWYSVSAIVQNRDKNEDAIQVLFAVQNVTEQKKKELEYQKNLEKKKKNWKNFCGLKKNILQCFRFCVAFMIRFF